MSEYQYYEFRALDRPLTSKQMNELRKLSSRAEITPTSFTNDYSYGGFRGNPLKLMEKYFDAFVYVANWGTHRLMLRVPASLLEMKAAKAYTSDQSLKLHAKNDHVIIEFTSNLEEGGSWEEGEGYLDTLLPVRAELMAGDWRSLYLGWLVDVLYGYGEEEDREPPVPPNMGKLSGPLQDLADFLWLEKDLIKVAASSSGKTATLQPNSIDRAAWIADLPSAQKDDWLLKVLEGDQPNLPSELQQRFQRVWNSQHPAAAASAAPRRTAKELYAAFERQREVSQAQAERKTAERLAREERAREEAHAKFLASLTERGASAWSDVEALIASMNKDSYDEAVKQLQGLKDLAQRDGLMVQFVERVKGLKKRHTTKSAFLKRLRNAGV
ncbi:MAG: hypothetical protein ACJ8FY_14690 [Gemmataceae bacterium]